MKIEITPEHRRAFRVTPDLLEPLVSEIVWLDYSDIATSHRDRLHLHHYHQLDVILDGEFVLALEGGRRQVGKAGDAWIVPPLVSHGVSCLHPFRFCSFKFHLAPRLWPVFGTVLQRFRLPAHVLSCVEATGKRSATGAPLSSQQAAATITLCLIELADQHVLAAHEEDAGNAAPPDFYARLWPLLETIQSEPSIAWSVSRMAGVLNLSPDYFSKCFRRVVGQTPQRYVLETAMRAGAAQLLQMPRTPVKKIAQRAGYANVQAFTHAFKHVFKTSPAAYRRQSALKNDKV
jgi:AraC-like DNA-binding protein